MSCLFISHIFKGKQLLYAKCKVWIHKRSSRISNQDIMLPSIFEKQKVCWNYIKSLLTVN